MDIAEYRAMADRLMADFKDHKDKYLTPDTVARHLVPAEGDFGEVNHKVMVEAMAHLKFTASRFEAAMRRRLREIEKAERKLAYEEAAEQAREAKRELAEQTFGGEVEDARDAVWKFAAHNQVVVNYDDSCTMCGKPCTLDAVESAIILAAEKNRYTLGKDKIMTVAAIRLAFTEFVWMTKDTSKQVVWSKIAAIDPETGARALRQLRDLCDKMFVEPAFADAAIRKFIWQVKRRMQGLYIEHLHFVVLHGNTGTGKTEFCREMLRPISPIVSPASIPELVDNKNFSLLEMFVGFADELAKADKADVNTLKNLVTGDYSTARVHYSHRSQRTKINLSLLGTADKPVATMIMDSAGMRRFIQVNTKPRGEIKLDWQADVVGFPWPHVWAAVDHTTSDPLMTPFGDLVKQKQEEMRARDNVEAWLEQFDPKHAATPCANKQTGEFVEYRAQDLYSECFREYEDHYHPSHYKTSVTTWGTRFKGMIDAGCLPRWAWRSQGHAVFYRYSLSNVVDFGVNQNSRGVVALKQAKK